MERERINRDSVSRTIQQKNNFGGAYMVDNRSDKNLNYLSDSPLQRVGDEDEETLQGKLDSPLQRVEDEDDTLQGKFDGTLQKKNETGMPDNLKAGIESLSGFSMDDVRVHYNSSKPATVQALAYTQGTDIHVAPGQEKHLPHEAWHVAQQMAGRVSPTTNINGMTVNDNDALEHEADVMGEKAVQMKSDESETVQRAAIGNGVVQCVYSYNPVSNIINDRPEETETIKGEKDKAYAETGIHFTAHHKYPWDSIKNDIQNGFTAPSKESSLKTLDNLERFSGENFPEPRDSFLKSPNDRETSYNSRKKEYDTWIQNVCWTPGNIFLGPSPKDRLDDPKDSFDGHYTRPRAMSIRSEDLKEVFESGGLSKKEVYIRENAVAPYVADEWEKIDRFYYQKHGHVRKTPFKSIFSYKQIEEDRILKHKYDIIITVPNGIIISKITYELPGRDITTKEKIVNPEIDGSDNKYSFFITETKYAKKFIAFINIISGGKKDVEVSLQTIMKPTEGNCMEKLVELPWDWFTV